MDAEGTAAARVVAFDQFEEVFTLYQQHWPLREPFFLQIADALADDPLLRVIIAIREDYLAQLDRYAPLLPEGLRTRLRLARLGADAALTAVRRPVATTGRLARPLACAPEDARKYVRLPIDHVGVGVAARRDQSDVFGNWCVSRTCPLAIDYFMEVVR